MLKLEKFIQEATRAAGKSTLRKFGKITTSTIKTGKLDFVTEADLLSNKMIIGSIKKNFPEHGIISEETGEHNIDSEYTWIIDPIDGTLNFSKKIPLYVILVALRKKDKLELACAYDPVHDEMYFAKRGGGAYLNGKRIYCSKQRTVNDSTGFVSDRLTPEKLALMQNFGDYLKGGRVITSGIHCAGLSGVWVANGRMDWNITSGTGHIWDYAAPCLIADEAGCKVTNFQGKPWDYKDNRIIIANPVLHAELMKVVNGRYQ